ncbi:MAG: polyketide cyclase [Anaerolineae bacterium]|nr:polyketide cyclase [Anaerolineales bacterium]MCQ3976128.1 polyketide cyclase [Anaerolineae bacterium]
MASNEYHFISHWRVQGTAREVFEILADAPDLTRWWPSVYLDVQQVQPGDSQGVGKVVSLYTKGWLPYTLRWQFRVTEANPPYGFSLEAWGDFVGRGIWTFEQADEWLNITYDWRIRADKPLLRSLSFIFKPIFAANHRWAMAKGEESLRLELARRRARTAEERALIPAPPGPTSTSSLPLLLMGAAILAGGVTLIYVARRK